MPARREEHPDEDMDQSIAVCESMWRERSAPAPVTRAWSTLEVKSLDAERREIEGIASTPTVDRVGDIVEPMGAKFTLPIPLLHHHKHDQPVGHVTHARASKNGITIKAGLAKVDEPGALKDRIDLAWQEIKAGLVRGLSIGFKPLDYEFLDDKSGGLRFNSWSWFELSLVTIPANADAQISVVRSIDQQELATQPKPIAFGEALNVEPTMVRLPPVHKPVRVHAPITAYGTTDDEDLLAARFKGHRLLEKRLALPIRTQNGLALYEFSFIRDD
jgi:HK97 family phage prohead protease